jgi:hypothetical protein
VRASFAVFGFAAYARALAKTRCALVYLTLAAQQPWRSAGMADARKRSRALWERRRKG